MESGQLHVPAALPLEKKSRHLIEQEVINMYTENFVHFSFTTFTSPLSYGFRQCYLAIIREYKLYFSY
jgi:hypothetical protein